MAKHKTPLLDQLESGPWPSFVSDLKQQAEVRAKKQGKSRISDSGGCG
jgi:sulfite reductase alpha subunit